MPLLLTIVGYADEMLPAGRPLVVELRDTLYEDAPAAVLQRLRTTVPEGATSVALKFDVSLPVDGATIWAHIDSDADGLLSAGDYVSVESYPLPVGGRPMLTVKVRRIG